jgi:hypothetical protein
MQTPTLVFDIEVVLCLFFYMVEGLTGTSLLSLVLSLKRFYLLTVVSS